ncbi:MAG: hypothetical protein M1816_000007 [Peltula sp. TS41687]|nr:MAG: hypothetical protein M1816_000007 [Peltula sp. TS41687]
MHSYVSYLFTDLCVTFWTGFGLPGEMVLVLGKPGAGCSTFLKVIANQRSGYSEIGGSVRYGPLEARAFAEHYRGEVLYNDEADIHLPSLTVGQTLGFALDSKTPRKRRSGVSKREFKSGALKLVLTMLNLEHTANTLIGDAHIRGISGGERKRVSIAEMMLTGPTIFCWDNSTRGLDASTALEFTKSLRILAAIYGVTHFASLYQASEDMFKQFDKVLLLNEGREVYYGPCSEAAAYFEALGFHRDPRQTTPDFLTGCTDSFTRRVSSGNSAARHDADSLARAFIDSDHHLQLGREICKYREDIWHCNSTHKDFEEAYRAAKRRHRQQPFFVKQKAGPAKAASENQHGLNNGNDVEATKKTTAVLTFDKISYSVGNARLLHNIFGYVRPGELTALMGASGAGKTTLLDILAARKNVGIVSGNILLDGKVPGPSFQRKIAYAEQFDVHEGTQTVREALRFSAELRQAYDVPLAEKHDYVEHIISLLEMEEFADIVAGNEELCGLTVEQKKRLTIGVELASKPEVLLFLDEPTTGLDSQSAFNIIRILRRLSDAGQAVLCTIHHPNSMVFASFDRLLLLQRGGNCVYFGEIGEDASVLRAYLARNGAACPSDANPAEFILELTSKAGSTHGDDGYWARVWENSPELNDVKRAIETIKVTRGEKSASMCASTQHVYGAPSWYQFMVVFRRACSSFWRSPQYGE